jgi:hypothetical protein
MILAEVSEVGDPLVLGGVTAASWTITGTATFLLGLPGGRPELVLRMSRTGAGRLRHESAVLAALTEGPGLTAVRDFLPTRRGEGAVSGWHYVLDDYIPGVDATAALAVNPGARGKVEQSGAALVTALHKSTARPVRIDDKILAQWVDGPIDVLSEALRRTSLRLSAGRLALLRQRLHQRLLDREVQAGWIHGDFWLGNIRVDPDAGAITGVIDWDCAGRDELPAHDLLHLGLYGHSLDRGVSLGSVVAETVVAGTWPAECEAILRHGRWAWGDRLSDADIALLYWLRYTAVMIAQQRDYVHHSILIWEWRNIVSVLRSL